MTTSISTENPPHVFFENVTNVRQESQNASFNKERQSDTSYENDAKSEHYSKVIRGDNDASTIKKVKRKNSDPDIQFNISVLPKSSIVTRSKAKNL